MAVSENRVWNVRALMAVLAFLFVNGAGVAGLIVGELTFKDYMVAMGAFNGVAVGWLFRDMTP